MAAYGKSVTKRPARGIFGGRPGSAGRKRISGSALDRLLPLLQECEPLRLVEIHEQAGADLDRLQRSPSSFVRLAADVRRRRPCGSYRFAWFAISVWPRFDSR